MTRNTTDIKQGGKSSNPITITPQGPSKAKTGNKPYLPEDHTVKIVKTQPVRN